MVSSAPESLLIVEDSDEDFAILQRLMQRLDVKTPVYRCIDGDEVLELLDQVDSYRTDIPRPSVILLDLNLPGTDGRELLSHIKQDSTLKEIPIVVFTTSDNPRDIEYCYREGANGYLIKPLDTDSFQRLFSAFVDYWLTANISPINTPRATPPTQNKLDRHSSP
jgi:CheY-like chemotaxis protein